MAFFRALESIAPADRRLFHDPFAVHFLGAPLRRATALARMPLLGRLVPWYSDRRLPGARTSAVARTWLIDHRISTACSAGALQVVFLGAGFDCRACRLPALQGLPVFEVDHPATAAVKREGLRRLLRELPANVRFVETDFDRESLADALRRKGFDPSNAALFVWEGVTNYLSAPAVDATLRFVGACPAGAEVVFTYVDARAFDGSGAFEDAAELLRSVRRIGEPWTFGLEPKQVEGYLAARGLHLELDHDARQYRRLCFGQRADRMRGYDFYHVAVACTRSR